MPTFGIFRHGPSDEWDDVDPGQAYPARKLSCAYRERGLVGVGGSVKLIVPQNQHVGPPVSRLSNLLSPRRFHVYDDGALDHKVSSPDHAVKVTSR